MRDRTEDQVERVLIRHGAVRANQERRYIGRTDDPLSREGIGALIELRRKGLYPQAGLVFSSPMKRCLETAGILYPEKTPDVIPEWREMDFGVFEGKNHMDLKDDGRYQAWIDSGGALPFPEGESREAFARRCGEGLQKMIGFLSETPEAARGKTVCAVVHGGTIMSLLSRYGVAGGDYFDYQVSNGKGYRCLLSWDGLSTGPDGIRNVWMESVRRL